MVRWVEYSFVARVGRTMYIQCTYLRYVWQVIHQMYGHVRCINIYTVLANLVYCRHDGGEGGDGEGGYGGGDGGGGGKSGGGGGGGKGGGGGGMKEVGVEEVGAKVGVGKVEVEEGWRRRG